MSALAKLRDSEIFRNEGEGVTDITDRSPPPTPSDGFVGSPPGPLPKIAAAETGYRCKVTEASGDAFYVCSVPAMTWRELTERYPGAQIQPVPSPTRKATENEQKDIR